MAVVVPAPLTLAVIGGGVRMPLVRVAETPPAPVILAAAAPVILAAPAPVTAARYVAPVRPRKQDRN